MPDVSQRAPDAASLASHEPTTERSGIHAKRRLRQLRTMIALGAAVTVVSASFFLSRATISTTAG